MGTSRAKRGTPLSEALPELAAEWHPTKNGDLTPDDISFGSATKVWWQRNCVVGEPPHEWTTSPNQRTRDPNNIGGCAVCRGLQVQVGVNDLVSLAPEAAREWHPSKNGDLRVENMIAGSHKRVWWRCSSCEHNGKHLLGDVHYLEPDVRRVAAYELLQQKERLNRATQLPTQLHKLSVNGIPPKTVTFYLPR